MAEGRNEVTKAADGDGQIPLAYKLARIPAGITGLDSMVGGGLPFPSSILVAGAAGTGKTSFGLQFLAEGAAAGERCLFITTLSESIQWMLRFGTTYNFLKKEYFGREIVYDDFGLLLKGAESYKEVLKVLEDRMAETMPQRLVIDPITVFEKYKESYRDFLYDLSVTLKDFQTTAILTAEVEPDTAYPPEVAYVVDGVLLISTSLTQEGTRQRHFEVLKLRGTNHVTGRHLLSISRDGLAIHLGIT